jgi:hypothetical protein
MPGEAGFASKGREGMRLTDSSAITQSAIVPGGADQRFRQAKPAGMGGGGGRMNAQGRQNASTIACILLLRPPFVSPIA